LKDEVLKDVEAHRRLRVICEVAYCLQVPEEYETKEIERSNGHLPHIRDNSMQSCEEQFNVSEMLGWVHAAQRPQANHHSRRGKEAVETCGQKNHTEPA